MKTIKKHHFLDHLIGIATCSIAVGCVLSYIIALANVVGELQ